MPPRPADPLPGAADSLAAIALLAARWAERLLAAHEPPLTVTQYLALRAISDEELSAAELARRAGVSGPAVSQVLAGLAEAGLIRRTPVPADRRWQTLALSAAGDHVARSARLLLGDRFGDLLAGLPHPEINALSRALPQVAAVLSGSPPPRRPPPRRPPPPGRDGKPPPPGPRPHKRAGPLSQ